MEEKKDKVNEYFNRLSEIAVQCMLENMQCGHDPEYNTGYMQGIMDFMVKIRV